MNTLTISLKNIRKNLSFYALYLFSAAFVITVFFAFLSFSMDDIIVEKISSDGRVESMCRTVSIFLMAFVIFYMTYSNRFFLRRRTEELGIYALLGYRRTSILALLCCENVFLCTGALLLGLFFGSCLHRGIVLAVTALLDLNVDPSGIPFFCPPRRSIYGGLSPGGHPASLCLQCLCPPPYFPHRTGPVPEESGKEDEIPSSPGCGRTGDDRGRISPRTGYPPG